MRVRWLLHLLGVAVLTGLALVAGPGAGAARAHAYLQSSTPADGESVDLAPRSLVLRFTEHVVLGSTQVELTSTGGRRYPVGRLRLVEAGAGASADSGSGQGAGSDGKGETVGDTEEPVSVVADLPPLPRGAFHVSWQTLSSDDLHRSSGTLAFGIGAAVAASGPSESAPGWPESAARWAILSGLAVALGSMLVPSLLAEAGDAPPPAVARVRRLGAKAALLAVLGAAALLVIDVVRSGPSALTIAYAVKWAGRELALLALAIGPGRLRRLPLVAAGVAACVLLVLLGHFGVRGGTTWVVVSSLHLLASVSWAGSVALLAWLLLRRAGLGLRTDQVCSALRRFFWPAAACLTVVAVTGVYLASDVVVSVDAALLTTYGRVLLLKTVLVAVVGLLAWRTTRSLRAGSTLAGPASQQAGAPRALSRRVVAEAAVLFGAVGLAAVLASGQPAVSPSLVSAPGGPASEIVDRAAGDLQETMMVRPNRPGDSVVLVDVLDTRRPSPGRPLGVVVSVSRTPSSGATTAGRPAAGQDSTRVAATRMTETRWAAGVHLPVSGPVRIHVTVRRQGLADTATDFDWVVGDPTGTPSPIVSRMPVSPVLEALAAALAAGAALVWSVALHRHPGRSRLVGRVLGGLAYGGTMGRRVETGQPEMDTGAMVSASRRRAP